MAFEVGPVELERDTVLEIVAAVVPVALLIAALAYIGSNYESAEAAGTISGDGGIAILVAIALFVVVMAGIGLVLGYLKDGDGGDDDANGDGAAG